MNKINRLIVLIFTVLMMFPIDSTKAYNIFSEDITFYEVPLVCGAAPDIGCGSRIKPLFIETTNTTGIKESWVNRSGTVIAIIWDASLKDEAERENLIQPLFEKNKITAILIKDLSKQGELTASLYGNDKWYKGMEVDELSIEEAGVIAETFVSFAVDHNLLNENESLDIKKELEDYFKIELVKLRTYDELSSASTQNKWFEDGYSIFERHIGKEKADRIAKLFMEENSSKFDKCCDDNGAGKCNTKDDCCK